MDVAHSYRQLPFVGVVDHHDRSPTCSAGPDGPWRASCLTMTKKPVRGFLKRGLELDGHEVTTAIDGGDGLDRLVESGGAFDLLLTDIRMPIMDGIALSLAAKRDYPASESC